MRYLKNPNLPKSKVSKAIVSSEISKESEYTLNSLGIELVKIPKSNKLYDAIKSHPDIRLCHIGDNNIIAPLSAVYKGCKNNCYMSGNPALKTGKIE